MWPFFQRLAEERNWDGIWTFFCKIYIETSETLAIWLILFYNISVCPGCGLLLLTANAVPVSAAAEVRGSRINIREVSNMASDKRIKVTLACSECKQRNYNTIKNKKNDPDRLEMSKYCRFCKKHTSHKETK